MWRRRSWFSLKGKADIPGQTEGCPATSIGPRVPPVGSLQQRGGSASALSGRPAAAWLSAVIGQCRGRPTMPSVTSWPVEQAPPRLPSRLEGVAEEVERDGFVLPRPVVVLAVDDPGLRRMKLQTAVRQTTPDGLQHRPRLRLAPAMDECIVRV